MLSTIISGLPSLNLSDILKQVTDLVPTVLPAVIGFIAFRKGWKFLRSALCSA